MRVLARGVCKLETAFDRVHRVLCFRICFGGEVHCLSRSVNGVRATLHACPRRFDFLACGNHFSSRQLESIRSLLQSFLGGSDIARLTVAIRSLTIVDASVIARLRALKLPLRLVISSSC